MELAISVPTVLEKIDQQELCLQSAADIQTFLNSERGKRQPYSRAQILDLVNVCSGLSTRDVQIELVSRNPQLDFRESKKRVSRDRMQIIYTTSNTTEAKLERIRELRSHASPYMNREELIEFMAEFVLERIDPLRRDCRAEKRAEKRAFAAAEMQTAAATVMHRGKQNHRAPNSSAPINESLIALREEPVGSLGEIQFAVDFEKTSADEVSSKCLRRNFDDTDT